MSSLRLILNDVASARQSPPRRFRSDPPRAGRKVSRSLSHGVQIRLPGRVRLLRLGIRTARG